MDFIKALRLCGGSDKRTRSHVVTAKNEDAKGRVKVFRPEWERIGYPAKYVWVTQQNIPMVSIGAKQSMPLVLEAADLLAEDWEVLNPEQD